MSIDDTKLNTEYKEFLDNKLSQYIKEHKNAGKFTVIISKTHKDKFFKLLKYRSQMLDGFDCDENGYFFKSENNVCLACIVQMSFDNLLYYQKNINITMLCEELIGDNLDILIYYKSSNETSYSIYDENGFLNSIQKRNDTEMKINSDMYVLIPVERLCNDRYENEYCENEIIEYFKYKYFSDCVDEQYQMIFGLDKERFRHVYLGKIKCKIEFDKKDIGSFISAALILGIDLFSKASVLTLIIQNPFIPVSYMIEFMNQCNFKVFDESKNKWISFSNYINNYLKLEKRGIPNILELVLSKKECVNSKVLTSWLMTEVYSKKGIDLGEISLGEGTSINDYRINVPHYENAIGIYASRDVVVEYNSRERIIFGRLENVVSSFVCIELILFEEAAIGICEYGYQCAINEMKLTTIGLLKKVKDIEMEFIKTMDLWNPDMSYFSSQLVEEELREKFEINKHKSKLIEKQQKFNSYFALRRDIVSTIESSFLSIVGCVLTASSLYDLFVNGFNLKSIVLLIIILMYLLYRIIFSRLL